MALSIDDDLYPDYNDTAIREQRIIAQKFDITNKVAQELLKSDDPEVLFWLLLRHNKIIQMPSDKLDIIYDNREKLALILLSMDGYTPNAAVLQLILIQPNVSERLIVKALYDKKTSLDVLKYCTIPKKILDTYIQETFIKNAKLKFFKEVDKDTCMAILSQKNINVQNAEMFLARYLDVFDLLPEDLGRINNGNNEVIAAVIGAMKKGEPKNHFLSRPIVYDIKTGTYLHHLNAFISQISNFTQLSDDNIKQLYKLFIDNHVNLDQSTRDILMSKLLQTREAKDIMQSLNIQFVTLQKGKPSKIIVDKIVNQMFQQGMQIS